MDLKQKHKTMITAGLVLVLLLIGISASQLTVKLSILDYSEVRGVFIHAANDPGVNAETVCATMEPYGVNLIVIEGLGLNYARYPSTAAPAYLDWHILPEFVDSAHTHGMQVYVSMNVVAEQNIGETCTRYNNGAPIAGATSKPYSSTVRNLIKAEIQELVTKFDIDGFMFDYMRFVWGDEPYEDSARQLFIADTGLSDVNWGSDTHTSTGRYYQQFIQWRADLITDLARDMRIWIHDVRPNVEVSAAVWNFASLTPTYWKVWIGQDALAWAQQGIVDWVSPMMYTDNVATVTHDLGIMKSTFESLGVPVIAFIDSCVDAVSTPQNIADRITALRNNNAKGWIIWRYGGPGETATGSPDLRQAFNLLTMPPVPTIQPTPTPSLTPSPTPLPPRVTPSPSPSSPPTAEKPWYQFIIDFIRWLLRWN